MLDIIEADDIPLWRLCIATLHASLMLVQTILMRSAAQKVESY